jgi:hypothetical protein
MMCKKWGSVSIVGGIGDDSDCLFLHFYYFYFFTFLLFYEFYGLYEYVLYFLYSKNYKISLNKKYF